MKTPNYENTEGKHPIPHAKGIAKDEKRDKDSKDDKKENDKKNKK